MKYALDTNIITYYLKKYETIMNKVDNEAENDNIIIPPFVYFEIKKWLLVNNSQTKLSAFEKLTGKYGIDVISKEVFDLALSIYIKLRKNGITIDDGDILVAAYCIINDFILVTNNQKHYKDIENIQIENWTS
ncbi:MAG: PIN domain-containing protein [Leptospirales bacterium]|nr:PIN domain-containing protein [Leptospirales bacterium]